MAAPTPYVPAYNFTNFQTANPSTPLPANALDAELFDVKITTDQIIANLGAIQRSDNALANGIVTTDSLNTAVLNLIGGYNPRGSWVTLTSYAVKDVVNQATGAYLAVTAHTSGTFATDLAAGKWVLIAGTTGTAALSTLSDVLLTTLAANHLLSYNGTKWVNGFLTLANTPDGLLTFAKLNSAAFSTDGTFASANNTTLPTTLAVKTYCTTQAFRATGSDIPAASTTSLTGAFDYVQVTGNTTINAITLNANEEKWVRFTGTPQVTHNGTSLILPGAANITAAVNDRMLVRGLDGTNVICLHYVKANGNAVVSAATGVVSVKKQIFTASGTYTPTTGMLYCIVEAVGGGGNGGAGATNSGGCGGEGGAYARSYYAAAAIGASKAVTIGAGGAPGGNTVFGATLFTATGGNAGPAGSGNIGGNNVSNPVQSTGADINGSGWNGTPGASGVTAAIANGGIGGSSPFGAGGPAGGPSNGGGSALANSGGGGGGGGASNGGGSGASGILVVTEYCSQ